MLPFCYLKSSIIEVEDATAQYEDIDFYQARQDIIPIERNDLYTQCSNGGRILECHETSAIGFRSGKLRSAYIFSYICVHMPVNLVIFKRLYMCVCWLVSLCIFITAYQ